MTTDRLFITDEQAKQFAAIIFPDVKEYVETHREKYIIWCSENELENAA